MWIRRSFEHIVWAFGVRIVFSCTLSVMLKHSITDWLYSVLWQQQKNTKNKTWFSMLYSRINSPENTHTNIYRLNSFLFRLHLRTVHTIGQSWACRKHDTKLFTGCFKLTGQIKSQNALLRAYAIWFGVFAQNQKWTAVNFGASCILIKWFYGEKRNNKKMM